MPSRGLGRWGQDGGLALVDSAAVGDEGRQSGHSTVRNGSPPCVVMSHTSHPALTALASRDPSEGGASVPHPWQFTPSTIRDS